MLANCCPGEKKTIKNKIKIIRICTKEDKGKVESKKHFVYTLVGISSRYISITKKNRSNQVIGQTSENKYYKLPALTII